MSSLELVEGFFERKGYVVGRQLRSDGTVQLAAAGGSPPATLHIHVTESDWLPEGEGPVEVKADKWLKKLMENVDPSFLYVFLVNRPYMRALAVRADALRPDQAIGGSLWRVSRSEAHERDLTPPA